jgi:hypothetical protein
MNIIEFVVEKNWEIRIRINGTREIIIYIYFKIQECLGILTKNG